MVPRELRRERNKLIVGTIGLLLSGNLYFIKGLVDKLEDTSNKVTQVAEEVHILRARIDTIITLHSDEKELPQTRLPVDVKLDRAIKYEATIN